MSQHEDGRSAFQRNDLERYDGSLGECEAQCDIGCVGTFVAWCNQGKCDVRDQDVQTCAPGEEIFCSCASMMMGVKVCREDGSGYDDCVC